jgi:hypothetical protein
MGDTSTFREASSGRPILLSEVETGLVKSTREESYSSTLTKEQRVEGYGSLLYKHR